jgi:hypothetical protein
MWSLQIQKNRTNNINKYCQCANQIKYIEYNKLNTSTNNPTITASMRYSQYLKSRFR